MLICTFRKGDGRVARFNTLQPKHTKEQPIDNRSDIHSDLNVYGEIMQLESIDLKLESIQPLNAPYCN